MSHVPDDLPTGYQHWMEENKRLREALDAKNTELEKMRDEMWSLESWFLRHMAKDDLATIRNIAATYPASRPQSADSKTT